MGHEQVVHVIRVLLLLRENPLEQHSCRGILSPKQRTTPDRWRYDREVWK
jgi:hypothetical protein